MRPKTHTLIAGFIYQMVKQNNGFNLNYESFKYGSIKPDLMPKPFKIAHYKNKSFAHTINKIEKIQKQFILEQDKDLKLFSVNLGVIIHYIADYFCRAHNDCRYNFFPAHIIYENKLCREFSKINLNEVEQIFRKCLLNIQKDNLTVPTHLEKYINKKHEKYLNSSKEIALDISFSMELCLIVSLVIISNCTLTQSIGQINYA